MMNPFKPLFSKVKFTKLNENKSFVIILIAIISTVVIVLWLSTKKDKSSLEIKTEGNNSPAIYTPNGKAEVNYSEIDTTLK